MSERVVVGGLIADNSKMYEVAALIGSESFTNPKLANLFRHLQQFHYDSEPFDTISIGEKLGENWVPLCGELVSFALKTGNIVHHAGLIREKYRRERIKTACGDAIGKLINRGDTQTVINELSTFISSLECVGKSQLRNIAEGMDRFMDNLEERFNSDGTFSGLSTGLTDLDNSILGLNPGNFILIAGRPGMGKSILVMNIASHNSITKNITSLVFTLEMPSDEILQRLVSSVAHVDYGLIQNAKCVGDGFLMPIIGEGAGKIKKGKFIIDDSPSLSVFELKAKAIAYKHKHGQIGLVVADYLQLLTAKAESRTQEVAIISRELKSLAKQLECPVIAISRLNRSLESRTNRRPIMSDLSESGQLEYDADKIIFIYRDEVYNEQTKAINLAELIIGKARNCPKKNVVTIFDGSTQKFKNADHTAYDIIEEIKKPKKKKGKQFKDIYDKNK